MAIFVAKEVAAEIASRATGGASDFLSFRRMGTKIFKKTTAAAGEYAKRNGASDAVKKSNGGADGSGSTDELVRVRHHTSPDGANGIKSDGAINPGRGDPVGVHVETAPFGPSKTASAETGAFGRGNYVEFDAPRSSIQPTNVGPRNTGVIATEKPLGITDANPEFKRQ